MDDYVNHPSHYTAGEVECIDAIKSALGPELFCGYLWGNALKYLWRWPRKGLAEDLGKCEWYIGRMRSEGFAEPAKYDPGSGTMVPSPVLGLLQRGDSESAHTGAKPRDATRHARLFGTPERAARVIVALNNCRVTDCADCWARGACRYCGHGDDYDSLLEWLAEAE